MISSIGSTSSAKYYQLSRYTISIFIGPSHLSNLNRIRSRNHLSNYDYCREISFSFLRNREREMLLSIVFLCGLFFLPGSFRKMAFVGCLLECMKKSIWWVCWILKILLFGNARLIFSLLFLRVLFLLHQTQDLLVLS